MTAGYSGTPLIKKLGIKADQTVLIVNQTGNFFELLGPLPEIDLVDYSDSKACDYIHLFAGTYSAFTDHFDDLKQRLKFTGMLWICWPKKSSKLASDIDENKIRNYGLEHGLVDVKVCAIDQDWSGLKFMYRKVDRK